nr:putative integron gene cassette protein [uncultured bacterium]CAS02778.1 putative integron gene cassette protein [uncultured bacterium]
MISDVRHQNMRHIAATFLETTLRRGASLEQFMGGSLHEAERSVSWLELRPVSAGIELWSHVAPDPGDNHADIYDLLPVELEPLVVAPDAAQALAIAHSTLGASPLRWVNQGVVQDEFLDFLQAGRPTQWLAAGA